jgi:hypothetical protein
MTRDLIVEDVRKARRHLKRKFGTDTEEMRKVAGELPEG